MNKLDKVFVDFDAKQILWENKISAAKTQVQQAPTEQVLQTLTSGGFFDTGLLPVGPGSGVLAIRGGFGHLQVVYQCEPGLNHVIWGQHERDATAKFYDLAQPYRIWIADFINGNISGARHFYSLTPAYSEEVKLYHVNLPNTNCKGYSGTGVGWMCLYHRDDTTKYTVPELVAYAFNRASGNEAYNDANMSGTDGPRYYHSKGAPAYFTDPVAWQKKSHAEGFEWTLDEKLLLPVMVESMDSQERGDKGKHHLTLGDAMNGTYYSYYPSRGVDSMPLKPIAALKRGLLAEKFPTLMTDFFSKAVRQHSVPSKATMATSITANYAEQFAQLSSFKISTEPLVPHLNCLKCNARIPETEALVIQIEAPATWKLFEEGAGHSEMWCQSCASAFSGPVDLRSLYSDIPAGVEKTKFPFTTANIAYRNETEFFYTAPWAVIDCNNCGVVYPKHAIGVLGYDPIVVTKNNGALIPIGCMACMAFAVTTTDGISIPQISEVEVELLDYSTNPPTTHTATVASWDLEGPDACLVQCACKVFTHPDNITTTCDQGGICSGCNIEGTYVNVFTSIQQAIEEIF